MNDSIPNGVLEVDLEHATSLIMDEAGNAPDTAMLGQMMNSSWLGSSPE